MSAIPYEDRDEDEWDRDADQDVEGQLPERQRRQFFTRGSAALLALDAEAKERGLAIAVSAAAQRESRRAC